MVLMNKSLVLYSNLVFTSRNSVLGLSNSSKLFVRFSQRRRIRFSVCVPKAKKNNSSSNSKKKKSWWQKFFFDDDANWLGLGDDDLLEVEVESESSNNDEDEKFEAWKRRAEAIVELREAENDMRNEESRNWEDWILDSDELGGSSSFSSWSQDWDKGLDQGPNEDLDSEDGERGLVETVRDAIIGKEEDDILYEDRVFRYASLNSAKFLAILILIPWAVDFVVHDYVLVPFLDRYVKTVPLAAQAFDVRRSQKLEMIKELKNDKARYRLEVEIGKSPPLSDDDLWWAMRDKALELREEWRLENRKAFANILSDMVFGISLFILLYVNQSKVALLKFTGYKIINNVSDTGKAFLIILITDIFLGYHSESGWETLIEIVVDHYGIEVDQAVITIFVCFFPVVIDACVKLWMFKFLPRLSPRVATIFQEMKRH